MSKKRFSVKDTQLQESLGILLNDQEHLGEGRLETLPITTIHPAEANPRYVGRISDEEIRAHREARIDLSQETGEREKFFHGVRELADSIEKRGLLQPIVVREEQQGFRVLAGERRLLAHILLGKERIRAIVRPAASEIEERSIRLIENLQRENLSFTELIRGIEELDSLFQQEKGRAMEGGDLAGELHKHESTCRRYLQIVRAPKDVRVAIDNGQITALRPALALIDIESEAERATALHKLTAKDASEEDVRQVVQDPPVKVVEPRRGRRRQQINLGFVGQVPVIQQLMAAIAGEDRYAKHYTHLDWSDLDQVQYAWNELLREITRKVQ